MVLAEIIKELDAKSKSLPFEEVEEWLLDACGAFRAENPGKLRELGALYSEVGSFYRNRGKFDKGERAYREALGFYDQAKEITDGDAGSSDGARDVDYATTVNNFAGLYRMRGDYETAIGMFRDAQEAYRRIPHAPAGLYASSFNNLGITYLEMKEYEKALDEFAKAQQILTAASGEDYFMGSVLGNVALVRYEQDDFVAAAEKMREAAACYTASGEAGKPAAEKCLATAQQLERMKKSPA